MGTKAVTAARGRAASRTTEAARREPRHARRLWRAHPIVRITPEVSPAQAQPQWSDHARPARGSSPSAGRINDKKLWQRGGRLRALLPEGVRSRKGGVSRRRPVVSHAIWGQARLRRIRPMPARPAPSNASDAGSGTGAKYSGPMSKVSATPGLVPAVMVNELNGWVDTKP